MKKTPFLEFSVYSDLLRELLQNVFNQNEGISHIVNHAVGMGPESLLHIQPPCFQPYPSLFCSSAEDLFWSSVVQITLLLFYIFCYRLLDIIFSLSALVSNAGFIK